MTWDVLLILVGVVGIPGMYLNFVIWQETWNYREQIVNQVHPAARWFIWFGAGRKWPKRYDRQVGIAVFCADEVLSVAAIVAGVAMIA
jgi:hypothetical protein